MVDVMLVLLIIFMVITPMLNNKVNVDLPIATAAIVMENANKEDAVTVAVTRDGRAYLGGDQVSVDTLAAKITDKLTNKTDKTGLPARGRSRQLRQGDGCGGPDSRGRREQSGPADREARTELRESKQQAPLKPRGAEYGIVQGD